MVMTTCASRIAAAGESTTVTPAARAASIAAGTTSKPRTGTPAATRLAAMGPPM